MTLPYRVVIDGHDDAPFSSAALALAALEAVEPTGRYAYIDALHRDGVFRPVACVNSPDRLADAVLRETGRICAEVPRGQ